YKGHSMSDPQKYRTKEEVAEYQQQDPIEHCIRMIRDNKWMTEQEIEQVDIDIKAEVEECVRFAEESPLPTADELYKDVYVQTDYPYVND
ncbi:MAG: thiamine pyrophosphate-dependent enzyme, partial [Bacteroidota bacterium]